MFNFKLSFKYEIIYNKDIKKYIRNIAKNNDILITTRIDYDDMIYYDAVNDVRKAININKPMVIYGYCRGFVYFELNGKYYDYYTGNNNKGAHSVYLSLISIVNKMNDTFSIYDLGIHS